MRKSFSGAGSEPSRGSASGSRGMQASSLLEAVAEVEGVVDVLGLRLAEELRVNAVEGLGVAVVGALHRRAALRQREAGHLHSAEAVARALGLLEQLLVDLAAEHLVHAAHVAAAGVLVVVEVEVLAPRRDAAGRMDDPVAERAALAALVQLC